MEHKYRITVLVGIYNCESTLTEAIESLQNQTYRNFKIVLCDDGSTDNTYIIAQSLSTKYDNIILIKNNRNMGLNFTLNHCLEYADTEYVARMDGDDISLLHRFEMEIKFLDTHQDFAIVSGPMIYFDENGDYREGKGKGEITKYDFIHGSPICHAPCMMRTAALKNVGGYSEGERLMRVEDYHLWFKMYAAGYKAYMLPEPIYKMRDDRNAYNRRTLKNYINVSYVQLIGFKMLKFPWYYRIFCLRPILTALTPQFIYKYLHRNK